ncbi:DUF6078 family protein [Prevotella koreensis]|uniref:Uncharacterized protein n=1 Tax=Prevotella koreensis TaxID=2490854 RepID=A0A3S0QUR0_9BACT|nr:DUF6078 family protein [Prevotella koreensis]RUL60107.1 hypothetical protein EHV08_10380 [Prevotella koreensis]
MTLEEYNQLDIDYAHCAGTHCEKASQCLLRHTAYTMLEMSTKERYMVLNPYVVTGAQPCPLYEPEHKERYAWGISSIYDKVRAADLHGAKRKVMSCFGPDIYYKVKQQRRAITEEEQRDIRLAFTEMGYDGYAIEFDRFEEQYPALMRLVRYK